MIDSDWYTDKDRISENLVADIDDDDLYWGPPLNDDDVSAIKNLIGGNE